MRRYHGIDWFAEAVEAGVLDQGEAERLREAEAFVARAIAVDHFNPAEVQPKYKSPDDSAGASQEAEAGRVSEAGRTGNGDGPTMQDATEGAAKQDNPALRDWRFEVDFERIAWAIFDREGENANALGRRAT